MITLCKSGQCFLIEVKDPFNGFGKFLFVDSGIMKVRKMTIGIRSVRNVMMSLAIFCLLGLTTAQAGGSFTLDEYRKLKMIDKSTAQLVLQVMREAIFYGQESIGRPVVCASPMQLEGPDLILLMDQEIANPTNVERRFYDDTDPAAFVFIHALRDKRLCW